MYTEQQLAAINSPEYRAALEAQQDYDSTPEGRRELEEQLAASADAKERRSLRARIVSGTSARRFRREQADLMPPSVKRTDPTAAARRELANAREDVARSLGFAAAETDAFGRPTPATMQRLRHASDSALDADRRAQEHPEPYAHLTWPEARPGVAPWANGRRHPAEPGDAAIIELLGLNTEWADGQLLAVSGDPRPAEAWGYTLVAFAGGYVVTERPTVAMRADAR